MVDGKYQDIPCSSVWWGLAEAGQLLTSIWAAVKQGQVVLALVLTGKHTQASHKLRPLFYVVHLKAKHLAIKPNDHFCREKSQTDMSKPGYIKPKLYAWIKTLKICVNWLLKSWCGGGRCFTQQGLSRAQHTIKQLNTKQGPRVMAFSGSFCD